jgi:hypothetical protein
MATCFGCYPAIIRQAFTVYSKLLFGDASSVPSGLTRMDIFCCRMRVDDCGRKLGMNGVNDRNRVNPLE